VAEGQTKKIQHFEDLIIWQKAVEFAAEIYRLTESAAIRTDFGLKDQLRRAAVSVSANIAEGFERRSRAEYLNFLNVAKASAGETRSLLEIAARVGYLTPAEFAELREASKFLSGSITNHMKSLTKAGS
jgi:four helix bundle protein